MKCEACGKEGTLDIRATLIRCSFCDAEGGKDFCPKCKPRRKHRRRSRTTVVLVNNERKTERG